MNKQLLPFLFFFLIGIHAFTQETSGVSEKNYMEIQMPILDEDGEELHFDQVPMYPDGLDGIYACLNRNIKYPNKARRKEIEGVVIVKFEVLKDGSVGNVEVFEGVHPLLDEEAVRVVKTFDRWMPGVMDGEKVSVAFNLPIRFRLVEEE